MLEVGDRVRGEYYSGSYVGTAHSVRDYVAHIKRDDRKEGSGVCIAGYGQAWVIEKRFDGSWGATANDGTLTILDKKTIIKTNMTKLNVMMKKLLDKDIQLLIKADYINGDLEPTVKGKAAIDALNFIDRKEELVVMAKEDIEEEKNK